MTVKQQIGPAATEQTEVLASFASELVRQVSDYGGPFRSQVEAVSAACVKWLADNPEPSAISDGEFDGPRS